MSAIVCDFCGAETTWSKGLVAEHTQPENGKRCVGSGYNAREAAAPRDCTNCGAPLSLKVRSAPSLQARHHSHTECIKALRDRIESIEASLRFRFL